MPPGLGFPKRGSLSPCSAAPHARKILRENAGARYARRTPRFLAETTDEHVEARVDRESGAGFDDVQVSRLVLVDAPALPQVFEKPVTRAEQRVTVGFDLAVRESLAGRGVGGAPL